MSILVTRSSMPTLEEYLEEIKPIFESHHMTNMGPIYKKLQQKLIDYLCVSELLLFVNGHMALEMAIDALGLKEKGGEVITTPFTFVSTTHSITRNGLTPVFCDIKPDDYTINPETIEALITEKTVAIVPVHVYGSLCDVEEIGAIAKRHNLIVIYDAAHAFGVTYKGVGVGNFGDASMFSLHATKVFNTIEGGAVAFHDGKYREKLHELKNFGIHGEDDVLGIGGNAKMDEFRAAMGICNLRRMDECIARRKAVHERYNERLGNVPGIRIRKQQEGVSANYSYYPVYFDREIFGNTRDDVYEELKLNDIFARKYFYPAINELSCYADIQGAETPIAHDISMNILTLPMYEELTLEDVDRICDIVLGK
ncbi:putative PLP-dependent enzyme possibly involved in cell wall biogenesis [Desulfosporosinus orientis DSM 765]|uniref:Putative PLP-dependent enzyme possibly involved in cell wall biogenesis n=1 Tax=Desulfosporosinus orientis (strain ATCC 19365 / DSM 765 / NCIMB 8382 / VKM B-1628 / Singapore I) TaxID=768706 RepID=G7WJS4_DESOD|nr:DegT/DnrJ/EryC1/StrS family aminotransferase [Desulfosporosinus orientis]AET70511.1 putative PLP-dependent enzyme possibly involved in cell wall biogenesis [Desulfosporosinus orientis DSM 765]